MQSRRMGARISALALVVLVVSTAMAQPVGATAGQEAPGGAAVQVRSPEIAPDGTVTFRLAAPQATSVLVRNPSGGFADWPGGNEVAMAKGENGVWSASIGPIKPEYYVYIFVVDGVLAMDPQNIVHVRDGRRYGNALRIANDFTRNYAVNDVPHGDGVAGVVSLARAEDDAAPLRIHAAGI
jgi:hypothetical protein